MSEIATKRAEMLSQDSREKDLAFAYSQRFYDVGNQIITLKFGLAFAIYLALAGSVAGHQSVTSTAPVVAMVANWRIYPRQWCLNFCPISALLSRKTHCPFDQ